MYAVAFSWFIHRCGRTARYKHTGNAVIFLAPSELGYVTYLRRNQSVEFKEMKIRCSEDACMKMMDKLRFKAVGDRDFLEKGSRAFVSYIESYLKRDCQILCNLKDLDIVKVAHCFGVLRLPRMAELDGRDFRTFLRCPVNTADIPYLDKDREAQRQKMLKKRRIANEKYFRSLRANAKAEPKVRKRNDADLINEDYGLLKKLKKKKISAEEFEEKFCKNKK
ncbi:unnamed protein product [Soboliphyme baturini]|uniref:DUF4217 domain-containing protein n=1 Tax=Soboliphyme baturini TaxID=241478 RepID=A0A183IYE2_9BILA|nr:unnamed protein product [Soboliphyme baturini]